MEIKEAQEKVDAWINTTGVRYFSELTNIIIVWLKFQSTVFPCMANKERQKFKCQANEI